MIPYVGGKSNLTKWVISNFPENYQQMSYCEVFGGGGWILFKKDPSYLEIYNDLNKDLTNLFRTIRDNYQEFSHRVNWTLHSREMYQEAKEKLKNDEFLSEVERAMYYAINRVQSFAGNGSTWGYQVSADKVVSGKWLPFLKRLELINARLKKVQIECIDFERLIRKYDTPNTLFYVDPPYVDAEFYYDTDEICFRKEDHERLAQTLKSIKGKFVLSYYDHELVRELYKGFNFQSKETAKHSCGVTVNSKTREKPRGKEVLIKSY